MKSDKAIFYNIVLTFLSFIAAIVLGETFLRVVSPKEYYVWPPGLPKTFQPTLRILPGINGISRFSINEHGVRGEPLSENRTYRILTVGGSTTECLWLGGVAVSVTKMLK